MFGTAMFSHYEMFKHTADTVFITIISLVYFLPPFLLLSNSLSIHPPSLQLTSAPLSVFVCISITGILPVPGVASGGRLWVTDQTSHRSRGRNDTGEAHHHVGPPPLGQPLFRFSECACVFGCQTENSC